MGILGIFGLGSKKPADFLNSAIEARDAGKVDQSERELSKAIELAEESKDYDTLGHASFMLGELLREADNKLAAEKNFRRAVQVFDDSDDNPNLAKSLTAIADLYFSMTRF